MIIRTIPRSARILTSSKAKPQHVPHQAHEQVVTDILHARKGRKVLSSQRRIVVSDYVGGCTTSRGPSRLLATMQRKREESGCSLHMRACIKDRQPVGCALALAQPGIENSICRCPVPPSGPFSLLRRSQTEAEEPKYTARRGIASFVTRWFRCRPRHFIETLVRAR